MHILIRVQERPSVPPYYLCNNQINVVRFLKTLLVIMTINILLDFVFPLVKFLSHIKIVRVPK